MPLADLQAGGIKINENNTNVRLFFVYHNKREQRINDKISGSGPLVRDLRTSWARIALGRRPAASYRSWSGYP